MTEQDESTELWAEVIAAVEYLREGPRPGLNVWQALEEGLRFWLAQEGDDASASAAWSEPDSLRTAVEMVFRQMGSAGGYGTAPLAAVLHSALLGWIEGVRRAHNDGKAFVPLSAARHALHVLQP
jgi:hypothetical protein